MSTSTASIGSTTRSGPAPVFWEVLWRSAGLQSLGLFVVSAWLVGAPPRLGASADELANFYAGHSLSIAISAAITGLAVLNLMWFAAAIRVTLANAGKDGWGAAATAASAAFGALLLLYTSIGAALTFLTANSSNAGLASSLNDLSWCLMVLIAFPRAMLIMSAAFGLWRAQLISNGLFALGVVFVVLGVLGGTTWIAGGVWAPDGAYTRIVSPALLLVWVLVLSWVLFTRRPVASSGW